MNNALPTDYQSFIHKSRYARWLDDEGRRETWSETVGRYMKNLVRPALGDKPKQIAICLGLSPNAGRTRFFMYLPTVSLHVSLRPSSSSQRA